MAIETFIILFNVLLHLNAPSEAHGQHDKTPVQVAKKNTLTVPENKARCRGGWDYN
jgi:hypothetical protein